MKGNIQDFSLTWETLITYHHQMEFLIVMPFVGWTIGRRLNGVTFPKGLVSSIDKIGKRTYDANFEAEHGKLE